MPRSVADILSALERIAPLGTAADWDPVGLQIGDSARSVTSVAVCHEITQTVLARLLAVEPSLIVTYHPLIFRPMATLTANSGPEGRVLRLAEAGIAVIAMHTNFDAAPGGTSDALAASLALASTSGFARTAGRDTVKVVAFVPPSDAEAVLAAMAAAGAGVIGTYHSCAFVGQGTGRFVPDLGSHPTIGSVGEASQVEELRIEMVAPRSMEPAVIAALRAAHPYEEPAYDVYDVRPPSARIGRIGTIDRQPLGAFANTVAATLDADVRVAGDRDAPVRTVAVVPGSGGDFVGDAIAAGADVLVTGDVSHHRARAAGERGLAVIDAGHGPTERPGVKALYASVVSIINNVIDLTGVDDSPWEAM